jgi:hypothetical protein
MIIFYMGSSLFHNVSPWTSPSRTHRQRRTTREACDASLPSTNDGDRGGLGQRESTQISSSLQNSVTLHLKQKNQTQANTGTTLVDPVKRIKITVVSASKRLLRCFVQPIQLGSW